MASALLRAQLEFAQDTALLIQRVAELGLACKYGEAFRPQELQELWYKLGKTKTLNSRHRDGLAIDLHLFRGDKYLTDWREYEPLGVWWEELRPGEHVWGGRWSTLRDGVHFERRRP